MVFGSAALPTQNTYINMHAMHVERVCVCNHLRAFVSYAVRYKMRCDARRGEIKRAKLPFNIAAASCFSK